MMPAISAVWPRQVRGALKAGLWPTVRLSQLEQKLRLAGLDPKLDRTSRLRTLSGSPSIAAGGLQAEVEAVISTGQSVLSFSKVARQVRIKDEDGRHSVVPSSHFLDLPHTSE